MKLLILGGTVFLGRAIVEAAKQRGHTLTLFNRGQSQPGLFPEVEQIHGDRDKDLSLLKGRTWDAVIDTCCYIPRHVRSSAAALCGAVGHYTFISTLSVFDDWSKFNTDENGHLGTLKDESVEEVTGETYGPLKVLCEKTVEEIMPGHFTVIRPGLIVGPHDPTDRFTYYPVRVSKGGEVLAPGRPERGIQFIDVRDLAEFTVKATEDGAVGPFNSTGPAVPVSMETYLQTSKDVSGSDASFTWVAEEFLMEQKVGPWMEVPLWLPELDPSTAGGFTFNIQKAVAAGLTFRPLAETLHDTIQWAATRPADHEWGAGMKAEREKEVLQAWKTRPGA
jgi:2'-hydroxyisoflavone reductase